MGSYPPFIHLSLGLGCIYIGGFLWDIRCRGLEALDSLLVLWVKYRGVREYCRIEEHRRIEDYRRVNIYHKKKDKSLFHLK